MQLFEKEILDFISASDSNLTIIPTDQLNTDQFGDYVLGEIDVIISFYALSTPSVNNLEKVQKCLNNSKRTLHIWEDQWKFSRNKIKSKIKSILGDTVRIHGRATNIQMINNQELIDFLKVNHLNVPIKGKHRYGLSYKQKLVAVASFSGRRIISRDGKPYKSYELLRFCNKLDHTVIGGLSKLIHSFILDIEPDDIMTYVDRDWSQGSALEKLGFEQVGILAPMEFNLSTQCGERYYTSKVQVSKYQKTQSQLEEGNYVKVYNSGSIKFLKRLK